MKNKKDILALRLRLLINKENTFQQTLEDIYNSMIEQQHNGFFKGIWVGAIIAIIIMNFCN